jgi:protein gp37
MNKSSIEWTENTWNPITGCTQISDGCKNCYAKTMAKRLKAMKNPRYINEFDVTIHRDLFKEPLKRKKSQIIFVCSMSDLFHESIPFSVIDEIFNTMKKADWHVFQVLTKRSSRLKEYSKTREIPMNVWVGVTIENISSSFRLDDLKSTIAYTKFISAEPLLGSLAHLDFDGVDWVVVGGESGHKSRPIKKEWVIEIKNRCEEKDVKFFFKQWGGFHKKKNGRLLDGVVYDEMPNLNFQS